MKLLTLIAAVLLSACAHQAPQPSIFRWENPPEIGRSKSGQALYLGGLSGLCCAKREGNHVEFVSHTDRGPNAGTIASVIGIGREVRPFILPAFAPALLTLSVDLHTGAWKLLQKTPLGATAAFNGLPTATQADHAHKMELAINSDGNKLGISANGIDPEGICRAADGTYWLGEEYGPDLAHFSANGVLLERFSPGKGIPEIFKQRKANRGFEGVACGNNKVYAVLQSPLPLPTAKNKSTVRVLEFDPHTKTASGIFVFLLDDAKADKIGDLVFLRDKKFLIIEQDGGVGPKAIHKVVSLDFKGARNWLTHPADREPEAYEESELRGMGVAQKAQVLDLVAAGFDFAEKIEGLAVLDDHTLLVASDNDFGLNGDFDFSSGAVGLTPNKSAIGIFRAEF